MEDHDTKEDSSNVPSTSDPEIKAIVKIKQDHNLILSVSPREMESRIKCNLRYYELEDKLNCVSPAFPSDYALAHLSSMAYNEMNNHKDLLYGWILLTQAFNTERTNGYCGSAYFNPEHQQIVIAHRGTDIKDLGALWNDLNILFSKFNLQINSAITFTEIILKLMGKFNRNGAYLKLSFTGHSLGGWLAQVTTFTANYLVINEENKRFALIKESQKGYHGHTVVFESPGCKMMLEKLKTEYIKYRYGDDNVIEISIDTLDITTYLTAPNIINCCNAHIGKLYRILVDLSDQSPAENVSNSWIVTNIVRRAAKFARQHYLHTAETRSIYRIISCFDPLTGFIKRDANGKLEVQEVLTCPTIELSIDTDSRYVGVIDGASEFEKSRNPVNNESYDDMGDKKIKLNVFNETEIYFLKGYDIRRLIPKYESIIFSVETDDSKSVLNSAFKKLDSINFQIDRENLLLRDPNVEPSDLVSYVKQLNYFFPNLNRKKRATKDFAFDLVLAIYKTESFKYLTPIRKNSLEFCIDSFNRNTFFIEMDSQVLLQVEKNTSAGVLKIFKNIELIKGNTGYDDSNLMFLDVKTSLQLKQSLYFASFIEGIKDKYLFVIEANDNSVAAHHCLKEIIVKVRNNHKVKVILIVDKTFEADLTEIVGQDERSHHEGIQLSDLSSDTRKLILNRELINLQGSCVSLAQIIPEVEKFKSIEDLIKMATATNQKFDVCSDYLGNSEFDVFAVSNITKQAFERIVPREQLVTLFEDWNPNEINRFVVLSLDENQAQNQFENICWHCSHMFRIHWLHLEENQLILKASRSYCDGQKDNFIEKLFTKKLKTQVREVMCGCFVTEEDYNSISSGGKHLLQSIISTEVLMKLGSQEKINAGSELLKLGEIKDYYVERSLTTTVRCIFPKTLKSIESDIFAVGNINIYDFLRDTGISNTGLVMPYKQWMLKRKLSKTQFIILDVKEVDDQFKNICECYPDKNIHWLIRVVCCHSSKVIHHTLEDDPLHYHLQTSAPNVMFKLEKSQVFPDTANVLDVWDGQIVYKEGTNVGTYNEVLSTDDIRDDFVTIVGKPGMGKSTFFTHLALRKKDLCPYLWIVKLKMTDVSWESFPEVKQNINSEMVIEFLAEILDLKSDFEKSLFEYCLHNEKVVLILDAFDEVSPLYDDQIFGLLESLQTLQTEIKVKQSWLSSRPYALKDPRLNKAVYTLQGFDKEDQITFLLKFWTQHLGLNFDRDRYSRFMDELISLQPLNIVSESGESMAGIPLVLHILAEYYQHEFEAFCKYDRDIPLQEFAINRFYEKFIDKCIRLLFSEKLSINSNNAAANFFLKKMYDRAIGKHGLLALVYCHLDLLVSEQRIEINQLIEDINKGEEITGLINRVENGVPQFIHASFAEYFATLWLIEQMTATEDKERFIMLFKGLVELFEKNGQVALSLFNSQLRHDNKLKENLTRYLKGNDDLIETLIKFSDHYLNIIRFLITLGVDNGEILSKGREQVAHAVKIEDEDVFESICNDVYGDECDYASIILENQLLLVAAKTNIDGLMTSFLLNKLSGEKLKEVVVDMSHGETALHVAAKHNRLEVAKVLIDNGADVGLRNIDEYTALDVAIEHQNKEMVELLLYKWVINSPLDLVKTCEYIKDDDLNVIFMNFIEKCFWKNSGSSIFAVEELSQPNFHDIAGSTNHSLINSLMSLGAEEINEIRYDLTSMLHSEHPVVDVSDVMNAASHYKGNEKVLIALIGNVALKYPNYLSRLFCSMDGTGNTLLHMAAKLGFVATAELMIGLGADTNIRNSDGDTALSVAAKYGKYAFYLWLLFREDEAINKAVSSGDLMQSEFTADSFSEIIVKHSSDQSQLLTKRYDGGETMLYIAAKFNLVKLAEMIIDRGAVVNVRNDDNHTPLSLACKNGRLEMTKLLIDKGASINDDKQSPLLWAIYSCSHAIARFLIENGADVNAKLPFAHDENKCIREWTPLQFLVNRCHLDSTRDKRLYKDLAKILIFNGADVSTCFDYFPFHTAGTCAELVVLLIMCGAGIDAANSDGSLVTYLEEHWQSDDPNDQKLLRSVFLYSSCQRPEQLKQKISYPKQLNFALNYEKQMQEQIPQFYQLLDACKAKNIANIQQKLRDLLVDEIALNRAFNGIAKSLLSEFPDKVANRIYFTSILFECMELIEVSVSLLIKRDVISPIDFSLYGKLKFLSEHCRKYITCKST